MFDAKETDARGVRGCFWTLFITLLTPQYLCAVEPGTVAPDFTLPVLATDNGVNSKPPFALTKLSDYRGSVLYLEFWDSSCTTCRDALPKLNRIQDYFGADEAAVLSINLDRNPADALRFLARYPVNFPVASDPSLQLAEVYGVEALPTAFFIHADGSVQGRHEGFRQQDFEVVRARLSELVTGARHSEQQNTTLRGRE